MKIDEKCTEVQKKNDWSQRQLATKLGITEPNLISARKGRRPLPAHALAKLERLRGENDKSIVDQIISMAACLALAIVLLFTTAPINDAVASSTYAVEINNNANYGGFSICIM